jgi:inner membrane protein involved in colicin E2 resistance
VKRYLKEEWRYVRVNNKRINKDSNQMTYKYPKKMKLRMKVNEKLRYFHIENGIPFCMAELKLKDEPKNKITPEKELLELLRDNGYYQELDE